MSTRSSRRIKKKRSNTLDTSSHTVGEYTSLSLSPSPKQNKKLKSNKTPRSVKCKSPSNYSPKINIKSKRKNSRRRATSDAQLKPDLSTLAINFDTKSKSKSKSKSKTKPKTKKCKKYISQTPGHDYTGLSINNSDPFNINKTIKKSNKKSSMTPKVSLSTSIEESLFSSDDELNPDYNNNSDHNDDNNFKGDIFKLTDSRSITLATKDLSIINNNILNKINRDFNEMNDKLLVQRNNLLLDLENIYNNKKEEIIFIEQELFENGTKSKNIKPKEYEFNSNINYIINKNKINVQISKFGNVFDSNNTNITENKEEYKSDIDANDETEEYSQLLLDSEEGSMASKQKLILYEIQKKTMNKLDIVILMEKEARKKSLQATKLTTEVDEALKYIEERTAIINSKIALATPELDAAREAVSGINPADINEIKTLKSPPSVIENVITATVMILGHKIKQWRDVQKLLSYKFKPELLNFDTYTLSKQTRQRVHKKYSSKSDFNYNRVYEGSKVCGNLVLWVLSQINYSRMLDVIIPLEKEVKKLKKENKKKQKEARELIKIVSQLENNIKLYTNQSNQMIDHIIKSTDYELKQFSDKLQPLNQKFNQLLNNKVLE